MLQLFVLLLLVPVSSCDAPSLSSYDPSHDQPVSEEEYNAMKLLWEQKHKEVAEHQEVKRSKIKPSYITEPDVNNHHLDLLDVSSLSHHHQQVANEQIVYHKTSHEQSIAVMDGSHDQQVNGALRSRRQQVVQEHSDMASGSGSGVVMKCDDPPVPSNGDFVSNGSIVTYMCEEGFVLIGNRQRFCNLTTWMWNGSDPTCEGPCTQDEPYSGSCDPQTLRYYYHMTQDRCLPFDGCPAGQDGDNSYDSLDNCRDTCMASCNDSEGIVRLHHSVWITDDCQLCNCINGLVTCDPMDLMECPTLYCGDDDPITLVEGCCPVCPTEPCNTTEGLRLHNETWTGKGCEECVCTNGRVICSLPNFGSCEPIDNCTNGTILVIDTTTCCPMCISETDLGGTIASIEECEYKNITYFNGETFMEDLCTMCQCDNTTVTCVTETCTDCEQGTTPVNVSNKCCSLCLSGCELMEMEPETLPLFDGFCQSIVPIAKSECPTRCHEDDTIKCCITSFVTKADKFECEDNPGVAEDLKYQDADDCICEPCG